MFPLPIRLPIFLCILTLLSCAVPALGLSGGLPNIDVNMPTIMPMVKIEASRISSTTGTALIDKELIENLPTRNGSVNEIISIVPGVQFGEGVNNSFAAGEITPPGISISGSRFYENNYTIDGISNNNPIDPGNETHNDINKLPGQPQNQSLSPLLIEQIKVYNSNIPAEFGGFTGGQIDVETIDPTADFWGKMNYRTTRNNWTKFYISSDDAEKFKNSNSEEFQPKFKKDDGGFILNFPISNDTAVITSYHRISSQIPLKHLGNTNTQSRKRENFFLKLGHNISHTSRLSITTLYSPREDDYFSKNFKDSNYRLKTGGYSVAINSENDLAAGQLKLRLGYNGQTSERQGPKNRFFWSPSTTSIDWESGKEGGLGALETGHDELNIKADFTFSDFSVGQTVQQVKLGAEATHSTKYYRRPNINYYYYSPITTGVINCQSGDPACIEDEQFLSRRTKYFNAESETEVNDFAAYLQDSIAWERIEVFPGVRVSYNDLNNNLDIAPRFSASLDIFGNRSTILFAGKNRYYSGTLHTFSLYKSIYFENESRTTTGNKVADWKNTINYTRKDRKTETPYSDEVTVGALQKLLGGELKLQYIQKTNKNEITLSRDKTLKEYTLNNNGRSEHKSYQISWQRAWKKHFLEINSTWQETTSNHIDYETTLNEDDLDITIWYENKELYKHDIPRLNFNRPVVANLIYTGELPYGFTFTNVVKFRGPYTRLKNTLQRKPSIIDPAQSPEPYVYKKERQHSSLLFDWKISWMIPTFSENNAVVSLDIYNVFNRKAGYSSGRDDYELGRQYWAGVEFNF